MNKKGKVYKITCKITKRAYIGSTVQTLKQRWKDYACIGCKSQILLYRSLKKYGLNNHKFEEMWSGDVKDMLKYECLIGTWYQVLNPKYGLNCKLPKYNDKYKTISEKIRKKISKKRTGMKFSKSHKANLSKSLIGRKLSKEHCSNSAEGHKKAILQIDGAGKIIKEWKSAKDASEFFKVDGSCIRHVLIGNRKHCAGFKWKFKNKKNK